MLLQFQSILERRLVLLTSCSPCLFVWQTFLNGGKNMTCRPTAVYNCGWTTWAKLSKLVGGTVCDPKGCSPPGSSVHGILQVRIAEWVAIPLSRWSSQPRDRIRVSHTAGGFFPLWATRETHVVTQIPRPPADRQSRTLGVGLRRLEFNILRPHLLRRTGEAHSKKFEDQGSRTTYFSTWFTCC